MSFHNVMQILSIALFVVVWAATWKVAGPVAASAVPWGFLCAMVPLTIGHFFR